MHKVIVIITGVLAVVLFGGAAMASHVEPASAKKVQFSLVNGYFACDYMGSNTTTSEGDPACTPPVGPLCGFQPKGSGKVAMSTIGSASAGTQDIKLTVSAKGLNAYCENLPVCFALS